MYLMENQPLNAQQVVLIIEKEVSHSTNLTNPESAPDYSSTSDALLSV